MRDRLEFANDDRSLSAREQPVNTILCTGTYCALAHNTGAASKSDITCSWSQLWRAISIQIIFQHLLEVTDRIGETGKENCFKKVTLWWMEKKGWDGMNRIWIGRVPAGWRLMVFGKKVRGEWRWRRWRQEGGGLLRTYETCTPLPWISSLLRKFTVCPVLDSECTYIV